jgi:glycosyltransferase involved in cell wall biosynthesis
VYNGARFIRDALASVYAQTVAPDEVVVVDDGSSDATTAVLSRLEQELPPSFTWLSHAHNLGPAHARNTGLALTSGEYVAFLDHDDVWHPTKLAQQLQQFARDPDLALSFTAYRRVEGECAQLIQLPDWDADPTVVIDKLMRSVAVGPPSTVIMTRHALEMVPPFEPRRGEDWKMWLNVAVAGLKIGYLPDALVDYRWHGGNRSGNDALHLDVACRIFDDLRIDPSLPDQVRSQLRWGQAHWHMLSAIESIQGGDKARARRHILIAARSHPASIRPGWLRMLGVGAVPGEADAGSARLAVSSPEVHRGERA